MGLQMLSEIEAKKKSLGFMFAMRKQLLSGRSRGSPFSRAGGMCWQLRAREYAFDKWTIRLLQEQSSGLGNCSHIPSREIGSSYFQETHPELLFKECSHYCELASHADQIPRILDIAMRTIFRHTSIRFAV